MTDEKEMDDWVRKVLDAQDDYFKEHFPPGTKVNSGWGIDEVDKVVVSKIYGHGVLTTDIEGNHTFETFAQRAERYPQFYPPELQEEA